MTVETRNGCASPHAVIMAGGRSTRFGTDKACAGFGERTLLGEVAASLESAGFHVEVSTGDLAHEALGYPIILDRERFGGPLRALRDILEAPGKERILLTACDTPLLAPALARSLWESSAGFDITVLERETGEPSPLPGVYSVNALTVVRENLARGETSLKSLFTRGLKLYVMPMIIWRGIDATGEWRVNINTESDLKNLARPPKP